MIVVGVIRLAFHRVSESAWDGHVARQCFNDIFYILLEMADKTLGCSGFLVGG